MTEANTPLDSALEIFVYLPVGLAVTAVEEFPKLAAKGRSRVTSQVNTARVVGQFAVTLGRREIQKRWSPSGSTSTTPPPAEPDVELTTMDPDPAPSRTATIRVMEPATVVTHADGLAIPGYDSLSASQVVQRLAGLAGDELAAVGAYESSHRARRTVLTRVSQLQSS